MNPESSLVIDGLDCSIPSAVYLEKLRAGGVDCMHLSIEDMDGRGNVHPFVFVYERLDELGGAMEIAKTVAEIRDCKQRGVLSLVPTLSVLSTEPCVPTMNLACVLLVLRTTLPIAMVAAV